MKEQPDHPKLREVFAKAVELPVEQRSQFLDEACSADADLRHQVESLLSALECAGSDLLANPTVGGDPPLDAASSGGVSEGPGSQIGRYKLLEQIGEGGFGVVYMAEQLTPVRRKVAIKVIKPGHDTQQVIARFEAERQALAMMDHPNIAHVFDAGATETGQPYFVMELVRGIPITDYCDQNKLNTKERLELFITVCSAVQHAHQKGIIHRDIKPTNVLVTLHEGVAVPKVIDFGVAKATDQQLTEKTLFTNFAQMIGTPLYMSPEQAEMTCIDVDTRSDIYSLGVLLYELLTGTTPLDKDRLKQAAFDEIRRIIREEDPPRPSTRLSTMDEKASTISAAQRKSDPKTLGHLMRGEMDWIVMKALEKQRSRRYETANGLARDIERYLRDDAVEACPPSSTYRLKKFVRRNKGPVLAVSIVLLALAGGVIGTTVGLVRAEQARRAERQAKQEAQARGAESEAVLNFVENNILAAASPQSSGGLGPDVSLRQAIEAALPFVEKSFTDRPLIEARLRMTLGASFDRLGQPAMAEAQFERACALYTKQLGHDHPSTLDSMYWLGWCYCERGRFAEGAKLEEEVLALRKTKLGLENRDTLRSMSELAYAYALLHRDAEALKLREDVLSLRKATLGADDVETLHSMNELADSYKALGRSSEELKLREELLPLAKAKLGAEHQLTLAATGDLAEVYSSLGQTQEALKLELQVLALTKAKMGLNHRDTILTMGYTATCLLQCGRGDEAIEMIDESVRRARENGFSAGLVGGSILERLHYFQQLKDAKGCRTSAEMFEMFNETGSGDLFFAARCRAVTAGVFRTSGASPEAAMNADIEADRAMDWLTKAFAAGYSNIDYLKVDPDLDALRDREGFKALVAGWDAKQPPVYRAWELLTDSDPSRRDPVKVLALAQEAVAQAPQDARSWNTLGAARYLTGDLNGAILALQKSRQLALMKTKLGSDNRDTLATMQSTAHLLAQCGRASESIELIDEYVRRAHENGLRANDVNSMISQRLRYFQNLKDPFGCRASAEMTESFEPTIDPDLFFAASCRAVTADVFRASGASPQATSNAVTEANRAMDWLTKAVAASDSDRAASDSVYMKTFKDLEALRDREDFKALLAALDAKQPPVSRAWELVTKPDPSRQDAAKALALAQEAVAEAPQDARSWTSMGAARYLTGDLNAAILALQKSRELALAKIRLGPDPDTFMTMAWTAHWLRQCGRGSEAIELIDEYARRVHEEAPGANYVNWVIEDRLRYFEIVKDPSGCRTLAEILESFQPTIAPDLYKAACYRAVAAGLFRASGASPQATKNAVTEADRAMDWLTKAVAAGFSDSAHIKTDKYLDALRDREDFKALLADLDAKRSPVGSTSAPTSQPTS